MCEKWYFSYRIYSHTSRKDLRPNVDQKVGRATYAPVIEKKLQLVEPVLLKHARSSTADVVLSGP